jgi:hypothetical protein
MVLVKNLLNGGMRRMGHDDPGCDCDCVGKGCNGGDDCGDGVDFQSRGNNALGTVDSRADIVSVVLEALSQRHSACSEVKSSLLFLPPLVG